MPKRRMTRRQREEREAVLWVILWIIGIILLIPFGSLRLEG